MRLHRRLLLLILLLAACCLLPAPAGAAIQWSLSVVEGYYLPKLDNLNYILEHERVELGPRNLDAKPISYPVIYQGGSPEMPEMRPKTPRSGLQLQADINPRYAIVFGNSMAVFDSTKRDVRPFYVGFPIYADRETRFSLQLNQFWIGLKRHWTFGEKSEEKGQEASSPSVGGRIDRPSSRVYAEIGILAITRAYLTTDVWLHVYAPEGGFDFYKVTETGITGDGYATYLGTGGEYFLKNWISVGLDINYTVGGVKDLKYVHYFTVDPLEKDIIKTGDTVTYTDFLKGRILPFFLDLEGWDFKGQVRFYF